jgi:hypothetical protein
MNKFLVSVIVLVLIAGGAWWYLNSAKTTNPNNGQNSTSTSVTYSNTAYGFSVGLPSEWEGYAIVKKEWNGQVFKNGQDAARDNGPIISINAPVSANIAQDIPVMVFTHLQWNLIMAGNSSTSTTFMSVGAAPVPPMKLGENSKYVLAIPARYNYAFPQGYEKTDQIVQDKSAWSFFEPAGISFTSPKGGDVWEVGKAYKVEWLGGGDNVTLFLIDKKLAQTAGASVSVSERFYNVPNTGSYGYTVKNGLSGTYSWSVTDLVQSATSSFFTIK